MTLSEDGISTDRLLELLNKRIVAWERAEPHSRTEHEQAEAFTRAFAELDAELRHGGKLPQAWARAKDAEDTGYELYTGKDPRDGESKA